MRLQDLGIPLVKLRGVGAPRPVILRNGKNKLFKKGNMYAAKAAMPEESHNRRIKGLLKAWSTSQTGGRMTVRKKTRKRARLRATVAKEARDIQNLARTHAHEAMIRLAEIINDRGTQDSVAIAAAVVMFDRAYGKASQTNINMNADVDGKPSEITANQLDKRVAEVLARVEALTGGASKAPKGKKRPPDLRKLDPDTDGTTQH